QNFLSSSPVWGLIFYLQTFKTALARQALPLPSLCKKPTVEKSFVSVETSGFPFPLFRTFAPADSRARVVS
ncbi:MAG: hypothetical protein LUG87_01275, partial [Oscillospiraceae bacterium]|nr:hypothetical protein [Oscillospiraceae bacterium]